MEVAHAAESARPRRRRQRRETRGFNAASARLLTHSPWAVGSHLARNTENGGGGGGVDGSKVKGKATEGSYSTIVLPPWRQIEKQASIFSPEWGYPAMSQVWQDSHQRRQVHIDKTTMGVVALRRYFWKESTSTNPTRLNSTRPVERTSQPTITCKRHTLCNFTFKGAYPRLAADGVRMTRASLDELHLRTGKTASNATERGG